ncbi:T-complex protein 11-domain-containing protein [Phycomyces nitens]|nr:T-complex protein 11-domain-containing protein [Phycomyces nitens]
MSPENTGFYTVDADKLHTSRKPFHLQRRFHQQQSLTTLETAELKREAFLQERREKLHQKFQQVQSVVRQVKASREHRRILILQSLEAAETNRRTQIEERRMASKNLVERAKIIASQNIRRHQAEQERLRARLESRLKASEARRLCLQDLRTAKMASRRKQPKKEEGFGGPLKSKGSVKSSKISTKTCPETGHTKKQVGWSSLLKAYQALGLPALTSQVDFNELGRILHQSKVVAVTSKVLSIALSLTDKDSRRRARILLTAYMMLMCPREILQDRNGNEEQMLLTSAKDVLVQFETWMAVHGPHAGQAERRVFVDSWTNYRSLFEAWKKRDQKELVNDMIAYYLELSNVKRTLEEHDAEGIGAQLEKQLEQVKEKIVQVGGPGALERLTSLESEKDISEDVQEDKETKTPVYKPDLNTLFGSFSNIPNERLAHELIVNPDFKLEQKKESSFEQHVKTIATKAFFDKLKTDLENGDTSSLPGLLSDIRERLLGLSPLDADLRETLLEIMDIELIQQQAANKSLDVNKYLQTVVDAIAQLCAPVRDEAIAIIRQGNQPIVQIQQLLELLDLMALDLANFKLAAIRPHLVEIGVQYEQEAFAKTIAENPAMPITRLWLRTASHRLYSIASQRNPENIQPHINKPSHKAVIEDAFVGLVIASDLINSETVPETLLWDTDRLAVYQNDIQALVIVACLLMLAKNFGSPADPPQLATTLFELLKDPTTTIDSLALEVQRGLGEERKPLVRSMVDKTLSHTDTIYLLLTRRVAAIIRTYLNSPQTLTPAAAASQGLEHVFKPLSDVCASLYRLVTHHRKVYGPWYDRIISEEAIDTSTRVD